jgi:ketosteroid isomerase-like protein
MRAALVVLAGVLAATPALASDESDVLATLKAYSDAFNKGDTAAASALCAGQAVVIDDFPPHMWQGASACADWAAALLAAAKEEGDTDLHVAAAKPKQLSVSGDAAYAVLAAKYTYKRNGKPMMQVGLWTFALQKANAGWRIAGWSWGLEKASPGH